MPVTVIGITRLVRLMAGKENHPRTAVKHVTLQKSHQVSRVRAEQNRHFSVPGMAGQSGETSHAAALHRAHLEKACS